MRHLVLGDSHDCSRFFNLLQLQSADIAITLVGLIDELFELLWLKMLFNNIVVGSGTGIDAKA